MTLEQLTSHRAGANASVGAGVVVNLAQERASRGVPARPVRGCVNVTAWAAERVAGQRCQDAVDTKGLKGRGTLIELRHYVDKLAGIEREMVDLSTLSKLARTPVYLMVHRRGSTGYAFLRWRESGASKRHLSLEQIRKLVEGWPTESRAWVGAMSQKALGLNEAHLHARDALKKIRVDVLAREQHVLPRVV